MNIPVYAYVTKAKPYLIRRTKSYQESADRFVTRATPYGDSTLNGTIPFRFELNTVEEIQRTDYFETMADTGEYSVYLAGGKEEKRRTVIRLRKDYEYDECIGSCLTTDELKLYGKGEAVYAWHMDNLEILDKPLELSDFEKSMKQTITPYLSDKPFGPVISRLEPRTVEIRLPLTRAPQSWMWAWLNGKRVILMSIQSQWAEKIMNGKKTIEIRKTCPKEAL